MKLNKNLRLKLLITAGSVAAVLATLIPVRQNPPAAAPLSSTSDSLQNLKDRLPVVSRHTRTRPS